MIKYPDSNKPDKPIPPSIEVKPVIVTDSLQELIKNGNITVGTKVVFPENSATCVNAFGDTYVFSYDQVFPLYSHTYSSNRNKEELQDNMYQILRLFSNNILYVPEKLRKEVDFFFIPTATQIFNPEELERFSRECNIEFDEDGTTQFEYYKDSFVHRLKEEANSKKIVRYLTSTLFKAKNPLGGIDEYHVVGCDDSGKISSYHGCIGICFQITKKAEE